jgi:hypothetical protein
MTHTKTTSIGASAQFGRQNRRFKGQEVVYQSSHVLKETKGVSGWAGIFRSQKWWRGKRVALEPELIRELELAGFFFWWA